MHDAFIDWVASAIESLGGDGVAFMQQAELRSHADRHECERSLTFETLSQPAWALVNTKIDSKEFNEYATCQWLIQESPSIH